MALRQMFGIICIALHLLKSSVGVCGMADQSGGETASKIIPGDIDQLRISHKTPGSILELHRSHRPRRQGSCNVVEAKPLIFRRILDASDDSIKR